LKCSEVNEYLDMLMDDLLSDEMLNELEAHARDCQMCAENIFATIEMKEMLSDINEEVDVPLAAQAAWRKAVKLEAARIRKKKFYRAAGSVAAAAVAIVGIGISMGNTDLATKGTNEVYAVTTANKDASEDIAVIESDGMSVAFGGRMVSMNDSGAVDAMKECVLSFENVATACSYINDLVAEYEGVIEEQMTDGGKANLYITIPSENVDAFLSASRHLDKSGTAFNDIQPAAGDMTSLLMVLNG